MREIITINTFTRVLLVATVTGGVRVDAVCGNMEGMSMGNSNLHPAHAMQTACDM